MESCWFVGAKIRDFVADFCPSIANELWVVNQEYLLNGSVLTCSKLPHYYWTGYKGHAKSQSQSQSWRLESGKLPQILDLWVLPSCTLAQNCCLQRKSRSAILRRSHCSWCISVPPGNSRENRAKMMVGVGFRWWKIWKLRKTEMGFHFWCFWMKN